MATLSMPYCGLTLQTLWNQSPERLPHQTQWLWWLSGNRQEQQVTSVSSHLKLNNKIKTKKIRSADCCILEGRLFDWMQWKSDLLQFSPPQKPTEAPLLPTCLFLRFRDPEDRREEVWKHGSDPLSIINVFTLQGHFNINFDS